MGRRYGRAKAVAPCGVIEFAMTSAGIKPSLRASEQGLKTNPIIQEIERHSGRLKEG
jgi:hypothetical protein